MKILSKYVLKELVAPFIFALTLLTFVLMMNQLILLFNKLLGKGLSAWVTVDALTLSMPFIFALTVPMAVLVAIITAFGRLSSDNEITAIKASGISIYSLLPPPLIASCILASGMIWFNNHILPETNHRLRILLTDVAYVKPALELREGIFMNDFPNASMLVEKIDQEKSTLQNITLYDKSKGQFPRTIIAKTGKMEFRKNDLILTLYDGEIHEIDPNEVSQYRFTKFQTQTMVFKDMGSEFKQQRESSFRGDREMSAEMMIEEIEKRETALNEAESEARILVRQSLQNLLSSEGSISQTSSSLKNQPSAGISITDSIPGNKPSISSQLNKPPSTANSPVTLRRTKERQTFIQLQTKAREIEAGKKRIARLTVEVHKKYSIPVACITFILLGVPLGIKMKKGGVGIAIGLSLLFFLINWAFLLGGERLADRLVISPFAAMWSNNILMATLGTFFLVQTIRGESFLPRLKFSKIIKPRVTDRESSEPVGK